MVLQSKLEIREEELMELKGQYFEIENEINKSKEKHHEHQYYIDSFKV
jgi:predicted  nucleic acid-binding Zn-ribbon protein